MRLGTERRIVDWFPTGRTVVCNPEPLTDARGVELMLTLKLERFFGTGKIPKTNRTRRLCFLRSQFSVFVVGGSIRCLLLLAFNSVRVRPFCPFCFSSAGQMFVEHLSQTERSYIGNTFECEYARFVEMLKGVHVYLCKTKKKHILGVRFISPIFINYC